MHSIMPPANTAGTISRLLACILKLSLTLSEFWWSWMCLSVCQFRRRFFQVQQLMHWCLCKEPHERPSFKQVCQVLSADNFLRLIDKVKEVSENIAYIHSLWSYIPAQGHPAGTALEKSNLPNCNSLKKKNWRMYCAWSCVMCSCVPYMFKHNAESISISDCNLCRMSGIMQNEWSLVQSLGTNWKHSRGNLGWQTGGFSTSCPSFFHFSMGSSLLSYIAKSLSAVPWSSNKVHFFTAFALILLPLPLRMVHFQKALLALFHNGRALCTLLRRRGWLTAAEGL